MENDAAATGGSVDEPGDSSSIPVSAGGIVSFPCSLCNKVCKSRSGLTLHMRKIHPSFFHDNKANELQNINQSKKRWTKAEIDTLAKAEADLIFNHPEVTNINQQLLSVMRGRTLEGIKGKRRDPTYKLLVNDLLMNMRDESLMRDSSPSQPGNNHDITVDMPQLSPIAEQPLHDSFASMPVLISDDNPEHSIHYYLESLNNNRTLGGNPTEIELVLDEALKILDFDPLRARDLVERYLNLTLCDIKQARPPDKPKKRRRGAVVVSTLSKRKQRRADYANLQKLYRKSRKAAYNKIVSNNSISPLLETQNVFHFWKNLLTRTDFSEFPIQTSNESLNISTYIQPCEILAAHMKFSSAPGPDGLTVGKLSKIPVRQKCKLFTFWILAQWVPDVVLNSRTTFIPKEMNVTEPSKLRPITISSTLLRQFHKILAARLLKHLNFNPGQYGFLKVDGIAKAVDKMDMIFKYLKQDYHPLSAVFIDISKAFDSVSHSAIIELLKRRNVDYGFCKYVDYIYKFSKTTLTFNGFSSNLIHPTRGVRQGDPLSSIMFLIVMDYVFEHLPPNFSFSNNKDFNCGILAYADDVGLFSNNPIDLQNTLDVFCSTLSKVGLSLNIMKCRSMSWLTNKKLKTTAYHKDRSFFVNGQKIESLNIEDEFEYLGVPFTPNGRVFGTAPFIKNKLNLLRNSLLKPQQKLYLLRNMLLPCSFHRLVLGRLHIGYLKKIDCEIRAFIRGVLHLPHDFPNAAFYASVIDGGLGIPCMRWSIPRMARKRLGDLSERTKAFLMYNNHLIENPEQQRKMFRSSLLKMVDCTGLKGANEVPTNGFLMEPIFLAAMTSSSLFTSGTTASLISLDQLVEGTRRIKAAKDAVTVQKH